MVSQYRTLLVEDDAPLRSLTRTVLERSGRFIVVGEAGDGEAGAAAAEKLQPDVVLLDLAMPHVDGFQALPKIRKVAPAAHIIAVSMLQRDRYEREALRGGAAAFIDKGMDSRALVGRLLDILEPGNSRATPVGRDGNGRASRLGPAFIWPPKLSLPRAGSLAAAL